MFSTNGGKYYFRRKENSLRDKIKRLVQMLSKCQYLGMDAFAGTRGKQKEHIKVNGSLTEGFACNIQCPS